MNRHLENVGINKVNSYCIYSIYFIPFVDELQSNEINILS